MLDYPRLEYVNKAGEFDYGSSTEGKHFKQLLQKDLGLREGTDYKFMFLYNEIPKAKSMGKDGKVLSYNNPAAKELNPYKDLMSDYIDKYKPELIIPQGTLCTKYLIDKNITKCQGSVYKALIKDNEYYVLPLFRQGYVELSPNIISQRDIGINVLKSYLEKGVSVFETRRAASYHEPRLIDEFKKLVARCKITGKLSWDTEDNTLNPNRKGAKILIFSFSWEEGQGASLPLEHWEVYQPSGKTILGKPNLWTREELDELYDIINVVMQAKTVGDIPFHSDHPEKELPPETELLKVGHNIKFDLRFLMSTDHITWANNVTDTKIGYWLEISQEDKTNKKLSDLAYGLTNMGGYDAPLEDYKVFVHGKVFPVTQKVLMGKIKKAGLKTTDKTVMLDESDYEEIKNQLDWNIAKSKHFYYDGLENWCINIVAIPLINKYRRANKIVNDIDPEGSKKSNDFNYEWIPLELMSYYAAGDADCCLRIHNRLLDMMMNDKKDPEHKLVYLYTDYYAKITTAFSCLESWGLRADTKYMEKITVKYTEEKERLLKEMEKNPLVQEIEHEKEDLYEMGLMEFQKPVKERDKDIVKYRTAFKDGKTKFNPKSKDDTPNLLFKKMGYTLPYSKEYIKSSTWNDKDKKEEDITMEDYSAGKDTIEYLLRKSKKDNDGNYDMLLLLQQYSKVAQLLSSFTDKLLKLVSNKDYNVHGNYNITGTATSRSSSNQPKHHWTDSNKYCELREVA